MTEETLKCACENREKRKKALDSYERISKGIGLIGEGNEFTFNVYFQHRGLKNIVYPTKEEAIALFRTMRDRHDEEIRKLDKEFKEM